MDRSAFMRHVMITTYLLLLKMLAACLEDENEQVQLAAANALAMIGSEVSWFIRPRYSNSTGNFKQPKNCEDSSDLDEHWMESIAAQRTFI